ncbi:putative transaminase [Rosa chinensis]|uniref:Putative transaminase n=1 Tax=Rosa chinensis TaxID=74649 RepID=A0A2P6R7V2_ROSCH|nr:putative transaminase [Rosa chinensis]
MLFLKKGLYWKLFSKAYIFSLSNGNTLGLEPFNLVVENEVHRAVRGGAGSVNTIGNYALVLKTQVEAKADGFSDVLYLDSVHKRYVEQTSTANIFLVKHCLYDNKMTVLLSSCVSGEEKARVLYCVLEAYIECSQIQTLRSIFGFVLGYRRGLKRSSPVMVLKL